MFNSDDYILYIKKAYHNHIDDDTKTGWRYSIMVKPKHDCPPIVLGIYDTEDEAEKRLNKIQQ